jgi:hypothetical protein
MTKKTAVMRPRDPRFEECHRTIVGTTGSGKTWFAMFHDFLAPPRNFHKYSKTISIKERRVYFDTMAATHERVYQKNLSRYSKGYPSSVAISHTIDTFIEMWDNNAKFLIFAPEGDEDTSRYRAKVNELVRLIRKHQVHQTSRTREPCYIWFDEVSNLAPKHKESQVSFCFTRGRQVGIFATAISQQPRLVARYIYDESRYKIFFGLSREHWQTLHRNLHVDPTEDIMDELWSKPFQFYIYDGYNWEKGKVIKD